MSGASAKDDKAFAPNPITLRTGETITWNNTDIETHTVTADFTNNDSQNSSEFDSGLLDSGQSFVHTFEKTGHYNYSCMIHPTMKGTIIVES